MDIKREQQLRQANHLRSRRQPKCASCWTKCRFALVAGICLLLLAVPVHSRALADDEESNNSNSNGNALSDSSQQQSELDNNSSQQQQQRGADDSCDIHRSDPVHALMDRICELCHDMFSHQHPNTRAECRSGCFRSHSFKQCLKLFKPGRSQQKRRPVRTLVPSPEAIFVLDQQQQN